MRRPRGSELASTLGTTGRTDALAKCSLERRLLVETTRARAEEVAARADPITMRGSVRSTTGRRPLGDGRDGR